MGSNQKVPVGYGASESVALALKSLSRPPFELRERLGEIALCILTPCSLFTLLYTLLSLTTHHYVPWLCWLLSVCSFFAIILGAYFSRAAALKLILGRGSVAAWEDAWPVLLCFSTLAAWVLALWLSNMNWQGNARHWVEYTRLNNYVDVDPAYKRGQEMLDAGRVLFADGSWVDRTKAMAFKTTEDVYCVAPVTSSAAEDAPALGSVPPMREFWAAGVNCCLPRKPASSFHCGSVDDTQARSGLRILDESQQKMFRSAVEQAESAFSIQAPYPIFLRWTRDPVSPVRAHWEGGVNDVLVGVFAYLLAQSFIVALVVLFFYQKSDISSLWQTAATTA